MSSGLEELFLLQLRAAGLPEGEAEVRFHPKRLWRFDRAWREQMVAVEIEGGSFVHGRHQRPSGFEADCVKYSEAALAGWRVIRATGAMVEDGRALAMVERAIKGDAPAPSLARQLVAEQMG